MCPCGHQEKCHILGVCAVLDCHCVRRDLQMMTTVQKPTDTPDGETTPERN